MPIDALSRTFAALAHPARRTMLSRLGRGEASVKELARPLEMSAPAVTKHLKVLEASGLISRGRDAQRRPCRLETAPLERASDWMAECRREWAARFDRLERYLAEIQSPSPPEPPPPTRPVRPARPTPQAKSAKARKRTTSRKRTTKGRP